MSFLEIKIGVPGGVDGDHEDIPSTGGGDATDAHARGEDEKIAQCCGITYSNYESGTQSANPHHPGIRIWETVVVLFITVNALLVMFMVAFDSTKVGMWLMVYFCDAINMVDMILTFFTAYINNKGIPITDKKSIMKRYFTTTFLPDFISVFPTDALVLVLSDTAPWKTLTQLRLNRLVRIYKVLKYFGEFSEINVCDISCIKRLNAQISDNYSYNTCQRIAQRLTPTVRQVAKCCQFGRRTGNVC